MHGLHANTTPFYIRDLGIHGFWYLSGYPGTNPLQKPRDNCTTQQGFQPRLTFWAG